MTMTSDQNVTGLAAAKAAAGNAKKLAALLDISGAMISRWGDTVPLNWMLDVERVTGIPRYILRPDLFNMAAVPPAAPEKPAKRKRAA